MSDIDTGYSTYEEHRPWGSFERFTLNQESTVKLIHINPHSQLSLQYHKHRDEFWKIVHGTPILFIAEEEIRAKEGDEFYVPRLTRHRIQTTQSPAIILEVATGTFDEDDIVRISDSYGRI